MSIKFVTKTFTIRFTFYDYSTVRNECMNERKDKSQLTHFSFPQVIGVIRSKRVRAYEHLLILMRFPYTRDIFSKFIFICQKSKFIGIKSYT